MWSSQPVWLRSGEEEEGTFSYFWSNGEGRGGGENFCLLFAKVTEGVRTGFANFQNPVSVHFLKNSGISCVCLLFFAFFFVANPAPRNRKVEAAEGKGRRRESLLQGPREKAAA